MCVKRTGLAISQSLETSRTEAVLSVVQNENLSWVEENPIVTHVLPFHVSVPPGVCLTGLFLLISAPHRVPIVAHPGRSSSLLLLLKNIQFHVTALFFFEQNSILDPVQ